MCGLIERSDPLVVTDLMEGGGTCLNPQRLGASGASWTQTSFRLGDADLTDPDRTGFSMLYPNLNALEAVSITTAGGHPDAYGSGTMVMLTPRMPASTWQRTFEFIASPSGFPVSQSFAQRSRAGAPSPFGQRLVRPLRPVTERLGLHLRQPRGIRPGRALWTTELPSNVATLSGHSSTGPAIVTTCRFSPKTGCRCPRPRGDGRSIPPPKTANSPCW